MAGGRPRDPRPDPAHGWTFLTNHGHVLVCIAQNADVRIAEIADLVGIGERAAHRILGDLINEGYVVREKVGRRNSYRINRDIHLRHQIESAHTVGDLIDLLG